METESNLETQLTPQVLRELTGEDELDRVKRVELSVDTESVTLSTLGSHLVNLVELKLTTPSYVPTLRKLGTLSQLRILWASAVGLENIDGTSGLTRLTELYISYNQITDLSPLAYLDQLEVLDLESNHIDSGLELRYLSFCPNLANVSMIGSPIAALPDYRKIVLARLPSGAVLDDQSDDEPQVDQSELFTPDDAILLKELVADGLLDEDELLENEPVTRPFTAMGLRPKTTQFTPFQRPSSAFKRPTSNELRPNALERSTSDLTQGNALQGRRGLMNRFKGHKTEKWEKSEIDKEVKDKLRNMRDGVNHEVNILRLDNDEEPTPIPERSTLARSIRTPKHEPVIRSKTADVHPPRRSISKELNPLRLPIKLNPHKSTTSLGEGELKVNSSRQEQLLAETREYKQIIAPNVPIIKQTLGKSIGKSELTQN